MPCGMDGSAHSEERLRAIRPVLTGLSLLLVAPLECELQRDVRVHADQEESGMTVSKDIHTPGASPDCTPPDETVVPVVR